MNYTDASKKLLDELLSPIPFFARPMAKKAMEKHIAAEAARNGHEAADEEDVIRGYIIAGTQKATETDKMKKFLTEKGIDLSKYQDLLA